LPEIRCQSCLSPGSEPTPRGAFSTLSPPARRVQPWPRGARPDARSLFCIGMIVLGAGIAIGVTSWRSLTLRQIGLVLFPAGVGTGAGYGVYRGLVEQWLRGILE